MITAAAPSLPPAIPIAGELVDAVGDVPVPPHATTPRVSSATAASSRALIIFDVVGATHRKPSWLIPAAVDAVASIVINAPLSLRVREGIRVATVNLKRELDVFRRAVLMERRFEIPERFIRLEHDNRVSTRSAGDRGESHEFKGVGWSPMPAEGEIGSGGSRLHACARAWAQ